MMEAKGFFGSLFDYSFSSFVTPRIIKILYVLATILISLWTLFLIAAAFNVSEGTGAAMLLIGGPLFFLFSMIYARVFLELVIAFFRINGNVQEIRDDRLGGARPAPPPSPLADATAAATLAKSPAETEPGPAVAAAALEPSSNVTPEASVVDAQPEPESQPEPEPPAARYCENCGAERRPGGKFCTSCGHA
jgi:hypothetical protein